MGDAQPCRSPISRLISPREAVTYAAPEIARRESPPHPRQHRLLQRPRLRDDDEKERGVRSALRTLYAELEPTDPVERHRWLFAAHYVDCSDEIERLWHDDNEAYLRDRRAEAIVELHAAGGTEAVFDFAVGAGEPGVAGLALMRSLPEDVDVSSFVRCAAAHPQQDRARWAVQGLLAGVPEERLPQVASAAAAALEEDHAAVRFLAECLPGHPVGWAAVEGLSADAAERFWSVVRIDGFWLSNDELRHAVDRLLDVGRPRAALAAATYKGQVRGVLGIPVVVRAC